MAALPNQPPPRDQAEASQPGGSSAKGAGSGTFSVGNRWSGVGADPGAAVETREGPLSTARGPGKQRPVA